MVRHGLTFKVAIAHFYIDFNMLTGDLVRKAMLIPRGERVLMVKVKELIEGQMMPVVLGTRRTILAMDLEDIQVEIILPWNHQLMETILATPLVY